MKSGSSPPRPASVASTCRVNSRAAPITSSSIHRSATPRDPSDNRAASAAVALSTFRFSNSFATSFASSAANKMV